MHEKKKDNHFSKVNEIPLVAISKCICVRLFVYDQGWCGGVRVTGFELQRSQSVGLQPPSPH